MILRRGRWLSPSCLLRTTSNNVFIGGSSRTPYQLVIKGCDLILDLIDIIIGNISSDPFINLITLFYNFFIFAILALTIPIELFMMIKSDYIEEAENKKFRKYFNNHHSVGYFVKNVDMNKDFIIIEDTFFDNITEHGGMEYKCNLSEAKERFLIKNGNEYNIIIFAKSGYCSKRIIKIIRYCQYRNLPVCRIIDYIPWELVEEKETSPDNQDIIYYTINDN